MKRLLALAFIIVGALSAHAQTPTKTINLKAPRPKVGILLSGGGAKGAAHIGVLKYLEEVGIPVDYVAGTSMGAIIGGLYAMGYSPDELAQLIAEMNWSQYVGNSIERSAMSEEVRVRYSTCLANIPFSFNGILNEKQVNDPVTFLPSAYVNNTALINLFNDLCVGYQKEMDFNNLPIPFACVATDIKTGKEVDIRYGSVPTAMRASMAIPGVFAPVSMDNHLLVDGGLVNNFPADVLEEMGADIIIGVDVSDRDTIHDGETLSLPEVLNSLVNNATNSKRNENQDRCAIYLAPDITGYGTLSFSHDAIDTLVHRGYTKAKEFKAPLTAIKQHLDSVNGAPLGKQLRANKARNLADAPVYVNSIIINRLDPKKSHWLLRKGNLKINEFISEKDINRAVNIYRGTGAFDDITYNLTENGTQTIDSIVHETYTLSMNFSPTQPHVFGVGARYDTEEGAAMLIDIGLNEKQLNGFKINLKGRLSYNPRLNLTATYSDINLANFNVSYDFRSQHFKAMVLSDNYSNLQYLHNRLSAYISQIHLLNVDMAVGISYLSTSFDKLGPFDYSYDSIDQGLTSLDYFKTNRMISPYFTAKYDNLDDSYFAHRGIDASLTGHLYFDLNGSGHTFQDLSLAMHGFITPKQGRLTIIPQLYARAVFSNPQYANLWNFVGGDIAGRHFDHQMPFVGVNHLCQVPDFSTVLRCDLRYNFYGKHYLTGTYNFLMGFNRGEERPFIPKEHFSGVGLTYAYNSFIGPFSLTAQWSDCTKQLSVYFALGYVF